MRKPSAKPYRRLPTVLLPFLVLLGLGVLWSVMWFWAAGRAREAVDQWMAYEAQAGRIYACTDRAVGGFPFRIELRCTRPTADLPTERGLLRLRAERFVGVAQVYKPTHVIGELTGPLVGGLDVAQPQIQGNWKLAQASLVAGRDGVERVSLVVDEPVVVDLANQVTLAEGRRFESHARRTPEAPVGTYDLAVRATRLATVATGPLLQNQPADIELQLEVKGAGDLSPRPPAERLRDFAAADGTLRVAIARIVTPALSAEAKGDLKLDALGRPTGQIAVTARGVDRLVQQLVPQRGGGLGAILGAGAAMLGKPATLDGQPARAYDLTITDGRVRLGPLELARVGSLF